MDGGAGRLHFRSRKLTGGSRPALLSSGQRTEPPKRGESDVPPVDAGTVVLDREDTAKGAGRVLLVRKEVAGVASWSFFLIIFL